jgi:cell division protein FtsL
MIRLLSAVGVTLLILVSFGLYNGVYAAKAHERELQALTAEIVKEGESIRVLKAEWSYLNQPERLQALARKHLALGPTGANQIVVLASLPLRSEAWSNESPVVEFNDLPRRPVLSVPMPRAKPQIPTHEIAQ